MTSTILIVDDNSLNVELTSRLLTLCGYQILSASSGKEAIEIAQQQRPHLILLDINLPELDGWSVVNQIKALDTIRHIPIVALTANDSADFKKKAFSMGCAEFVSKPIVLQHLNTAIVTALQKA